MLSRYSIPVFEWRYPNTYLERLPLDLTRIVSDYLSHCPYTRVRLAHYRDGKPLVTVSILFGPFAYRFTADLAVMKRYIDNGTSIRASDLFSAICKRRGTQHPLWLNATGYACVIQTKNENLDPRGGPITTFQLGIFNARGDPMFIALVCIEIFEAVDQLEQWALALAST